MAYSAKKSEYSNLTEEIADYFFNYIETLDQCLYQQYEERIITYKNLSRRLVSFQANKERARYRWYKYKEAFSADLVEYLVSKYHIKTGVVLDPFAGAGTTLFACSNLGLNADGIELLPIGQEIINAGIIARTNLGKNNISRLKYWLNEKPWNKEGDGEDFIVLRITSGAYPSENEYKIKRYLSDINNEDKDVRNMLLFSLLCILESISYTRKDGQYLRWDHRSDRNLVGKNNFNKGEISGFDDAICSKLIEIVSDLENKQGIEADLFENRNLNIEHGAITLYSDSCLNILPRLKNRQYKAILTSPPYCNRYDYTRTYALEHAVLGTDEAKTMELRQAMLSCTVENKSKKLLDINRKWDTAISICDDLELLQAIIGYLNKMKELKALNNSGIARMVEGYFYEMACVIQESYRILKKNGLFFMVNDNVRYAGVSISVDLILSRIAENLGFTVENILVLPQGKGNSSQQMGKHGREKLRKCVYVWRKNN